MLTDILGDYYNPDFNCGQLALIWRYNLGKQRIF